MSAQASNPSHLLLLRHPRSPAHPQLAPTWTSRHPPMPTLWGSSTDDLGRVRTYSAPVSPFSQSDDGEEEGLGDGDLEDEVVEVHSTFRTDAALPGRIKVVVGRYEFWCHKEVLWFTCPFFQDVLQGSWAETSNQRIYESSPSPLPSHRNSFNASSAIAETDTDAERPNPLFGPRHSSPRTTSAQTHLPSTEEDHEDGDAEEELDRRSGASQRAGGSVYLAAKDDGLSVADILKELRELPDIPTSGGATVGPEAVGLLGPGSPLGVIILSDAVYPPSTSSTPPPAHHPTLPCSEAEAPRPIIPRPPPSPARASRRRSSARPSFSSGVRPASVSRLRVSAGRPARDQDEGVDAVIQLHEESAEAFQDFLFWAYPHLECKVTWTNVENLLALASKLIVPALQKLCEHFLFSHASGRPVMALALAEQHDLAEVFKEASRFVLDQPTWNPEEMEELSEQTQLKLSQRRTWFLERLLKLGSIDVAKEYSCRLDCPDPARCQFYLDEKWRQANSAVSRYGPPQPSVAFKCLRQLETFPTYPSPVMPNPMCQSVAKSWVMLLYDRMFQPKPLAGPIAAGTEKYWLFITLQ